MYRCELCGLNVPPQTRAHRVVLETREKLYRFRPEAFRVVEWNGGKRREIKKDDVGGSGWEIVREVRACPSCSPA